MTIVKAYLQTLYEFNEIYYIYHVPSIFLLKEEIDENLLKHCNLYIHQDIRKENGIGYIFSDEYIEMKLSKDVINITIPNLFGLGFGFFPQAGPNPRNRVYKKSKNGLFPHGDKNLNFYIEFEESKGGEEVLIEKLKAQDFYSKDEVLTIFQKYISKIRQREENWDVKILDFILENYCNFKLFYDPGHPTNIVMVEIVKRILKLLGLPYDDLNEITYQMDSYECPIYRSVSKALNLKYEDINLRKQGMKLCDYEMDFDEWVREYIFWCNKE